jgi:predicted metalloendopeptidase
MLTLLIVFLCLVLFGASDSKQLCSTLSCVHSSAAIISKINENIDPCEDFYEFSCGEFKEEQHTPDEKTTVDTIALMGDKLTEFLLTLLEQPSEEDASKLHIIARKFYKTCMDYGR